MKNGNGTPSGTTGARRKTRRTALLAAASALLAAASVLAARETPLHNGRLSTDLNAGGHAVTNLAPPSASSDAATRGYVDSAVANAAPADYADVSSRAMSAVQPDALAPYAKRTEVPTKVGALTNDAGYLTAETDPAFSEFMAKGGTFGGYGEKLTNGLDLLKFWIDWTTPYSLRDILGNFVDRRSNAGEQSVDSRINANGGIYLPAWSMLWTGSGEDRQGIEGLIDSKTAAATNGLASEEYVNAKVETAADSIDTKLSAKQDRPAATATAAALSLRADGAAISVSVAASGTLSASLGGWTDGQAQTALISLAPGASVAAAVSLVGYGSWPTNRFVASCVRVGPRVYVTPITALAE